MNIIMEIFVLQKYRMMYVTQMGEDRNAPWTSKSDVRNAVNKINISINILVYFAGKRKLMCFYCVTVVRTNNNLFQHYIESHNMSFNNALTSEKFGEFSTYE